MADSIRITLVLQRQVNPALYDDLQRFNKGRKSPSRVERLYTLAYAGLLIQPTAGLRLAFGREDQATVTHAAVIPSVVPTDAEIAGNELFGPSIAE